MDYQPEDLARTSFKYFFTVVLKYKWCGWHEQAYKDLREHKRILYEIARGHGKTVFFVSYIVWLIYKGDQVDCLFISYSEEQVKNNIMSLIERMISTNDYLTKLRPNNKTVWGMQIKTFPNGSQIRGESFGSSVRGAHPTHLFVDDPLKDRGGMTPEEQHSFFMTSLMGTVKRETQVVVDGTPLDNGDLLEQLENNKTFIFRKFPAENEDRTKALFPELFTLEELKRLEQEVGTFAYSRERLLLRIDPHSQIFKDTYRTINDKAEFPEFAYVRTIVDPAISEKEEACDSAVTTVGVDIKNNLWELDTRLIHSDDPAKILQDVLKVARLFVRQFSDYAIVMESEVFQKVLAYDLKLALIEQNINTGVIEVTHSGNQGKHQRIQSLQPSWEARAIHLLEDSPLIPQFRYYRPNAKGLRLDGIDAFSWIKQGDVGGPSFGVHAYDPGVPDEAWE